MVNSGKPRNTLGGLGRERCGLRAPTALELQYLKIKVCWYKSQRNWNKKTITRERVLKETKKSGTTVWQRKIGGFQWRGTLQGLTVGFGIDVIRVPSHGTNHNGAVTVCLGVWPRSAFDNICRASSSISSVCCALTSSVFVAMLSNDCKLAKNFRA
jgi:hypothetical protein